MAKKKLTPKAKKRSKAPPKLKCSKTDNTQKKTDFRTRMKIVAMADEGHSPAKIAKTSGVNWQVAVST